MVRNNCFAYFIAKISTSYLKKLPQYHILFQKADGFLKKVRTIVKTYTFPCHHNCALCPVGEESIILNFQHISQREMPYTEHSHPGRDLERICSVRELLLSCSQEELKDHLHSLMPATFLTVINKAT